MIIAFLLGSFEHCGRKIKRLNPNRINPLFNHQFLKISGSAASVQNRLIFLQV